eukprot:scaffold23439_cov168-Skeletonema_marinoi.AAC.1
MEKSGLEKRQIGKKRKEADERHATLFSFYCLPLRYILTPGLPPLPPGERGDERDLRVSPACPATEVTKKSVPSIFPRTAI